MRILQVVTYISPDGAYGGPVRVALNQAKALRLLGHHVEVAAAAGRFNGRPPRTFDSFPVHLFKGRRLLPWTGFAGLASPRMLGWLVRAVQDADVVHVHLARDLVTLPAAVVALLANKPLIVQTHGMIDRSRNPLAVPLDAFLTRRILRRAHTVLYLTEQERQDLADVAGGNLRLAHLVNGVPEPATASLEQQDGIQDDPEILYLSRLHPRKRPTLMVDAARALHDKFPEATFALVGPDEGEGRAVQLAIEHGRLEKTIQWSGAMPPESALARMRQASVFALPSTAEPFPMAVLEAMSVGLPVVVTRSCGLATAVQEADAGIVCDESPESFVAALEHLLREPGERVEKGRRARLLASDRYSLASMAEDLQHIYVRLLEKHCEK